MPLAASAAACACSWSLNSRSDEPVRSGQLREHVRHRDVGKDDVVPAAGRALVAIEAEEIVVEPVRAAHPRLDGQVRRRHAEPGLAVGRAHRDGHRVADLVGGEHQVVADLRLGQAEVRQPVVAHVLRGVAVEAVVDEDARAALLRRAVEPADRCRFHADVGTARCQRRAGSRDDQRGEQNGELARIHHPVTLSGTGFVWSRAVYQGISKKNRKYVTVSTRAITVARSAVPSSGQPSGNCPQTVTGTTPR